MKTILLIEDNALIRDNTAELLTLAGYEVQAAASGKAGIGLALAARPDLVICDIMMPELDGYGVLSIFNQNPLLAGIPFMFLSAKADRDDQRRGMNLGADDYLTKPFDEAELLSAVSSRLTRFQFLRPAYDLAQQGLHEFLDDARAVGKLESLSVDRKPHPVRRKHFIYLEGDEPIRLYFVRAGRVKTVKATAAGKELITCLYGPGEFFGYLPLLQATPHCDSAVAIEDTELFYIPKDDFTQLLLGNAEVSQQFVRLLAGRVAEREQQLLGMAYSSIRRRIADALLHLQALAGAGAEAHIHVSRDDLAALVGTTPESVIRTLSEFSQEELIELTPKNIRVLNPDKLLHSPW